MLSSRDIARAYLPRRHHYYYARSKLATDPLYAGVAEALAGCDQPLLDLGCGIGLLAHSLRAHGCCADYAGVDIDARKIESARLAAANAKLVDVRFDTADLSMRFPPHRGSVALLDVLQFLAPDAHGGLIDAAIDSLVPGARLVIRTGLHRDTWRMQVTRAVDRFSRWLRWMNAGPQRYPRREDLEAQFERRGLSWSFRPLRGKTPFDNWLIVAMLPPRAGD